MIIIGLTGSIGMGKSTVAKMFSDLGAAVWDADAAVHRIYSPGGAAVAPVKERFPSAIVMENGEETIDRTRLSQLVLNDVEAIKDLEAIVHPLVGDDRNDFMIAAQKQGAKAALFDIPLLFENNLNRFMAATIVVSASAETQRARVLARPDMDADKFEAILARQMPDEEKRSRADYVVNTDQSLEETRQEVIEIWQTLTDG